MQVLHEEVNFILSHLLINSLLICSSSVLSTFFKNSLHVSVYKILKDFLKMRVFILCVCGSLLGKGREALRGFTGSSC